MKHIFYFSILILLLTFSVSMSAQDLVILHTNDMHSSIEPHKSGKYKGYGGFQRVANYIKDVRSKHNNVLVIDAGDFNQGTPYYNLFQGELEIELMNAIDYDVVCLGNHEFDNGQFHLAKRLEKLKMPIVCANYDFTSTPLKDIVKPYSIVKKGDYKIGIIGCLVNLDGFVMTDYIKNMVYKNPYETVDKYAKMLKEDESCDIVIALSHLGYDAPVNEDSDNGLAANTKYIDIIIGGHSHTFLDEPTIISNMLGKKVIVVQAGARTMEVGRFDIDL